MMTLPLAAAIDNWRHLLWPIGGVLTLAALVAVAIWWFRHRSHEQQPILFLLEQLLWHFRYPLLLVSFGSLALIGMGFYAGSQVSMILFVLLSAITVVGIGVIGWWLWPQDTGDGNIFDLVPLPDLEWPAYENSQDKIMRGWVEHRTHQMKTEPPAFSGATFGAIALEVSKEAAEIYEKQTPLSVSLDDLLRGLERTAADLKVLCNHLPLAGHFTLAAIERQIDFAVRRGQTLYALLFLVLSFFNPGNLIRVFLAFFKQRSPWEHLLKELQGWVYGHYTERLGYHMALIHSRRDPPPPDALHRAFAEQQAARGESVRRQKLGWLAFLGLFGFVVYLCLQLANVTLVYGFAGFLLGLLCMALAGYGIWQLRAPSHWEALWEAILPHWPEEPPPEGERELRARRQMAAVLREHKTPPVITNTQEAKKLPEIYGDLLLALWQACYEAYRPESETDPSRTSREFFLPQGFAGVEDLCRALHTWFTSTALIPRTLRQLERFGLTLETIYLYVRRQSDEAQIEKGEAPLPPPGPPSPDDIDGVKLLPPHDPEREGTTAADDPTDPVTIIQAPDEAKEVEPQAVASDEPRPGETAGQKVLGWFGKIGRSLGNMVKEYAMGQIHQHVLTLLEAEIGERLLNIYGARHTQSAFAPQEPLVELRQVLLLARDELAGQELLSALIGEPLHPMDAPEGEPQELPLVQCPSLDGGMIQLDLQKLPASAEDNEGLEAIGDLLQYSRYVRIVLVDEIDYGARERIARLVQDLVDSSLRNSDAGEMALALTGVEKLKPLKWEPPYDDYLETTPPRRKSQRIRNAVLAWSEAIEPIRSMSSIYPVGLPAEGEAWGLPSLRRFIGIVAPSATPEDDASVDEADAEANPEEEAKQDPSSQAKGPTT